MKSLKEVGQAILIAIIVGFMGAFFGLGFGHGMMKAGLQPILILVKVKDENTGAVSL